MSVQVTDGVSTVRPGERLDYQITVKGAGSDDYPDAVVTAYMPAGAGEVVTVTGEGKAAGPTRIVWRAPLARDATHELGLGLVTGSATSIAQPRRPVPDQGESTLAPRTSLTVCVQTKADGDVLICDSDIDMLAAEASSAGSTWWPTVIGATATAICLIAVIGALTRQRWAKWLKRSR